MDGPVFAFDFDRLYNYLPTVTVDSHFTCPYPNSSIRTLTYEGCKAAVGTSSQWYTRQDVYYRVLLWRIPLLALWATTTLPALGWHTQIFTLLHLVADPVDTFWSLFYKLNLAKRNARWARKTDEDEGLHPKFTFSDIYDQSNDRNKPNARVRSQSIIGNQVMREARLKTKLRNRDTDIVQYYQDVVALIIAAYDEWGLGIAASKAMNYGFHSTRWTNAQRAEMRDCCASAAFFIASDRVARFLPSTVSTLVFLVQITAGFWKTLNALGKTYEGSNPVSKGLNRAPHNIAFGALFFWLPLAVLMTGFVGRSQTSHFVPRVLERFRSEVDKSRIGHALGEAVNPSFERTEFPDLEEILNQRWAHGGLPVWQTAKFSRERKKISTSENQQNNTREKEPFPIYGLLLSLAIVAIPTGCAMAVSWLTPTQGFGCRSVTQLSFFISWILSIAADWCIFSLLSGDGDDEDDSTQDSFHQRSRRNEEFARRRQVYWVTFTKDCIFACGTVALLTFTALGIFNNCDCWTKWTVKSLMTSKTRYLSFPQEPYIFNVIKDQLRYVFPHLVGFALLSQIILFINIAVHFREGWRVLKQRDLDTALNGPNWLVRSWRYCQRKSTGGSLLKRRTTLDEANIYRLDPIPSNTWDPRTPHVHGTAH